MLACLRRQRAAFPADGEARRALRRGIRRLRRRMGWHHIDHGRRLAACVNYLRAFLEIGDPEMLLRAGVALVPKAIRKS